MPWQPLRWVLVTSLLGWLLLSGVYAEFTASRQRLVTSPQAGAGGLSIALPDARNPGDAQAVLILRVRNPDAAPLNLSVRVDDRVVRSASIGPEAVSRIDVAWTYAADAPVPSRLDLTGGSATWTLEYLEIANLHGFTRGVVDLLILPDGQPFVRPPAWWLIAIMAGGALLLWTVRPVAWPRWLAVPWKILAATTAATLVVVAASPFVSPYRVVWSLGTFGLGVLILALPRVLGLPRSLLRASELTAAQQSARWTGSAAAALAAYGLFLASHAGAYAGGADSSGYLNSARLLADGRVRVASRAIAGIPLADLPPDVYVPLGFRPSGSSEMAPIYPIGLPLLVLPTAHLTGWDAAPVATIVWHGLLGVVLVHLLGRFAGLSRLPAALGALVVATSPLYLFGSVQFMSDTAALVWTTAAVLLAWRSRSAAPWAALAGAAFAMAVLVRPTNALVLAAVGVCLGTSLRRWAWLGAGGAPGAACLLVYNLAAYDGLLVTGYGDLSDAFGVANVTVSAWSYSVWFPVLLTPAVILAAGLPLLRRRLPWLTALLMAWIVPFCLVYAFYYHTHEAWYYMRFLLPVFPPLAVATLLVGRSLLESRPLALVHAWVQSRAVVAGLIAAAAILTHNFAWVQRLHATDIGSSDRVYLEVAEWTQANLPRESALAAMQVSGSLFYYTEFPVLRWDFVNHEQFARVVAALDAQRRPLYAVLFPFEVEERRVLADALPGQWTLAGTVRDVTIWRYEGQD
jgi:hypothetical protein